MSDSTTGTRAGHRSDRAGLDARLDEAAWHAILQLVPQPLLLRNPDGSVLLHNGAARDWLGLADGECPRLARLGAEEEPAETCEYLLSVERRPRRRFAARRHRLIGADGDGVELLLLDGAPLPPFVSASVLHRLQRQVQRIESSTERLLESAAPAQRRQLASRARGLRAAIREMRSELAAATRSESAPMQTARGLFAEVAHRVRRHLGPAASLQLAHRLPRAGATSRRVAADPLLVSELVLSGLMLLRQAGCVELRLQGAAVGLSFRIVLEGRVEPDREPPDLRHRTALLRELRPALERLDARFEVAHDPKGLRRVTLRLPLGATPA